MERLVYDGIGGALRGLEEDRVSSLASICPPAHRRKVPAPGETIPESYLDTITGLVHALEAKDSYTSGHSRRVATIAAAIAQNLGLPKKKVDKIALAGLIHDIGKIGVREDIPGKTGRLTDEEYRHVISHCEIGERILRPILKDEEILDMVRHHHEHYDGTGYPDGLSGKPLSPAARIPAVERICRAAGPVLTMDKTLSRQASILSVADAYDAMMSPRSYRDALTAEEAAEEVRKEAGNQFDPEAAAALLRISSSLTPLFEEEELSQLWKEAERSAKEKAREEAEETQKIREAEELKVKTIELEQANTRLQEVDRLKSVFLASMSHELRTPLNAIIGFTTLILQGMVGEINDEQKEQLTLVKSSADHLLSLINDLLDLSKIEAGKMEPSLEEFNLDELFREVIDTFSPVARLKGIEITSQTPGGITFFSDRRRLKQVLMNLVSNATKFTERGSIKIEAGVPQDSRLEISVTDTGIGMKKEDMGKLFVPFQQIGTAGTRKHEGTGLGLYLTRKLVTLLGGNISVESEYGRGSKFIVTIPLIYPKGKGNEANPGSR